MKDKQEESERGTKKPREIWCHISQRIRIYQKGEGTGTENVQDSSTLLT